MTPEAIKDRLREMADVSRRARDVRNLRPAGYRSTWPIDGISWTRRQLYEWDLMQADMRDALAKWKYNQIGARPQEPDEVELTPVVPSSAEIDRMYEAAEWLTLIADIKTRRIVLAWAHKQRWKHIAVMAGTDVRQAQRLLNDGVRTIAGMLKLRAA